MNEELKTYYVYYDDEVIGQLLCENDDKADDYAEELFFDPENMDPELFSISAEEDEEIEEGLDLNEELSDHDWELVKEKAKLDIGIENRKDMEQIMKDYQTNDPFEALEKYQKNELNGDSEFKITDNAGDSKVKSPLLDFVELLDKRDAEALGDLLFDYTNDNEKKYKNIPSLRDLFDYNTRDLIRALPDDLIADFIKDFEWDKNILKHLSDINLNNKAQAVVDLTNMMYKAKTKKLESPLKLSSVKVFDGKKYYVVEYTPAKCFIGLGEGMFENNNEYIAAEKLLEKII